MTNHAGNEPTAEQIVRATLLRCQFDTLGDKVADVVKDLRAHGLLSEGAPSEEDAALAATEQVRDAWRKDHREMLAQLDKVTAERDAALAAIERVRAEADAYAEQPDVMEPCGAVAQALRAALDGAPEPEEKP